MAAIAYESFGFEFMLHPRICCLSFESKPAGFCRTWLDFRPRPYPTPKIGRHLIRSRHDPCTPVLDLKWFLLHPILGCQLCIAAFLCRRRKVVLYSRPSTLASGGTRIGTLYALSSSCFRCCNPRAVRAPSGGCRERTISLGCQGSPVGHSARRRD